VRGNECGADPWPRWPDDFAESKSDRDAALVLSALRGLTPRRLLELATVHGRASAVLAEVRAGRAGGPVDRALANDLDPGGVAAAAGSAGARVVHWGSSEYPVRLRDVHDPPFVLFVIGAAPPDPTVAVAIVGARRCSDLGRELARQIGRALGLAGVTVVSGAARGIDAAAHQGALDAAGRTLAVLGCGIDVVYPRGSRDLLERIRARGTVLSEHAPGTPPHSRNFPARNRIVSGLCRAVVIVEGAAGSGSMITAEHAMEFGREVYAVPGSVTSPLAAVPLQLIRDGATMIRGSEDLLEDLKLETDAAAVADRIELPEEERRVLALLVGPTLPDIVAAGIGCGIPETVGVLMRLELRGLVRGVGGRYEPTLKGSAASG
jgi:DNA processing protein